MKAGEGGREDGFALPSILMLVTILSLVAFSVIALEYLERESALSDVARLKAEYAAQSGVACMAAELKATPSQSLGDTPRVFTFADGSNASVRALTWGALYLVESTGSFHKARSLRIAELAERPGEQFSRALSVGNLSHQLVLTGSAAIVGDIVVGNPGATTGSIHGYSTPASLPVKGKIVTTKQSSLPQVSTAALNRVVDYYRRMIFGGSVGQSTGQPEFGATGSLDHLPDSVKEIHLPLGCILSDSLSRLTVPLYLLARGRISIGPTARLSGLITIAGPDSIVIENGARLEGCVVVALRGVVVQGAQLSSVQILSSCIDFAGGSTASYPTTALSIPLDTAANLDQSLTVQSGATIEGFVGLISQRGDDVLTLQKGSSVAGSVFSTTRLTLDGSIVGSAFAYDLYFFEAPATYLGWMRMGGIDRDALPGGFLIPPIFSGEKSYDVLAWN